MRALLIPAVFALLAPLTACYVGNTPPRSQGAPAAPADAAAEDDSAVVIERQCEVDADCGDNATCQHAPTIYFCVMRPAPPPADAGAPAADVPPTAAECEAMCGRRLCGVIRTERCGDVSCGDCRANERCDEEFGECIVREPDPPPPPDTRPRWTLRVAGASVSACSTDWDRCSVGALLCSPSLPDPVVRVAGQATNEASNTCSAAYSLVVGSYTAEELAAGFRVELIDRDTPVVNSVSGDAICAPFLAAFPEAARAAGGGRFTCPGGAVTFTLTPVP